MARILISLLVVLFSVYLTEQAHFLKQEYINKINDKATTWKAGVNFNPNTTKDDIVRLLGSKGLQNIKTNAHSIQYKSYDQAAYNGSMGIPKTFDARKQWRKCWTIGAVRNQGNCGSCWAVSTSSAFSDRLCIATNGKFRQFLSAEELLFCCESCGFECYGGYPIEAWTFFKRHGLVTGGEYLSYEGCQPYRVPPCVTDEYGINSCTGKRMEERHQCTDFCFGEHEIDHEKDYKYTRDAYYLAYESIQRDVMIHGPVEASFDVYEDFPNYKSGVYVKSEDAEYLGGHSVKLIGWGEEHGVPYWLIVNSWGEEWGDNGLFKIRRGTNECEIDDGTTAGVPVADL